MNFVLCTDKILIIHSFRIVYLTLNKKSSQSLNNVTLSIKSSLLQHEVKIIPILINLWG